MKDLLLWIVVILGSIIIWTYLVGQVTDKQTSRLYARAHLVETNDQARQNFLSAMLPYAIVGLAVIGGAVAVVALVTGAVAITIVWSDRRAAQPVIERQMIVMLQPGQSRREFYRQLAGDKIKLIGGPRE